MKMSILAKSMIPAKFQPSKVFVYSHGPHLPTAISELGIGRMVSG
jgi:hypothetical protein